VSPTKALGGAATATPGCGSHPTGPAARGVRRGSDLVTARGVFHALHEFGSRLGDVRDPPV